MADLTAVLDYPMFVVTVGAGGERAGCVVGFVTQCSIDPARFMVCLSRQNRTSRVAAGAEALAAHLLGRSQRDLAELFGTETGDESDKFARCRSTEGQGGVPLLDGCPGRFVGRILDRLDLGDHLGYLLEVLKAEVDAGVEVDAGAGDPAAAADLPGGAGAFGARSPGLISRDGARGSR